MDLDGSITSSDSLSLEDVRVQRTNLFVYGATFIVCGWSVLRILGAESIPQTDSVPDSWLIGLSVLGLVLSFVRLEKSRRISIQRHPPILRVSQGRIWPRQSDIPLSSGIYAESRGPVVLFFREGLQEELPFLRLHRRDEFDSLETIARIRRFLGSEEEAFPPMASRRGKPLTWTLVALNVLVFLADLLTNHQLLEEGYLSRAAVLSGEPWRIWSSMFLHAGFAHILMNMLAASSLLSFLEMHIGWKKAAFGYFLSGTFAGVWALLWLGSRPMVGASGAIFGLLGMITWLAYKGRSNGWNTELLPSRGQITQMIGINLLISLLPSISLAAHFGGFVGGWVFAMLTLPKRPSAALN